MMFVKLIWISLNSLEFRYNSFCLLFSMIYIERETAIERRVMLKEGWKGYIDLVCAKTPDRAWEEILKAVSQMDAEQLYINARNLLQLFGLIHAVKLYIVRFHGRPWIGS